MKFSFSSSAALFFALRSTRHSCSRCTVYEYEYEYEYLLYLCTSVHVDDRTDRQTTGPTKTGEKMRSTLCSYPIQPTNDLSFGWVPSNHPCIARTMDKNTHRLLKIKLKVSLE